MFEGGLTQARIIAKTGCDGIPVLYIPSSSCYVLPVISEHDIATIRRTSREYGLKRVLLFGSATRPGAKPRDIDLAVEGLDPSRFFAFYGDLIFALSLPVDVFDLEQSGRFADLIREEGVPIYG